MPNPPPPPPRTYRANFYVPENIIGYTGALHENPTVYFQDGAEFGHITQAHDNAWNIGREPVMSEEPGTRYVIENNDNDVAEEKLVNPVTGATILRFHTSRSKFHDARRLNIDVLAILAGAIWRFSAKKAGDPAMARFRGRG